MKKYLLPIITAVMLLGATHSFAYLVGFSCSGANNGVVNNLNLWSNLPPRVDELSPNIGVWKPDPNNPLGTNFTSCTTAQWKTIISQFSCTNSAEDGFARSQVTRNTAITNDLAFPYIATLLANDFANAASYGYSFGNLGFYDNALTINGVNVNYTWTTNEVQYMRTWLDTHGHANVALKYDARSMSAPVRAWCNNPLVNDVLLEAQPSLWFTDAGSRQELLQWLTTNPPTAGKSLVFQIPGSPDPYGPTNNTMNVRRLIAWLGDTLMGYDFMRRTNITFRAVNYNPQLQFYPEISPDGSRYTNTMTSLPLSLIEQRAYFEGRTGVLPTQAGADSFVRTPFPTISPIANQTTTIGVPTAPISFTLGSPAVPGATLTVAGTSSNSSLVRNSNILVSTWSSTDLGSVGVTGSNTLGDVITMNASGADFGGTADAGRFLYQPLSGNGSMVARVTSLQPVSAWSKAGVMMRSSTNANSANCFMHVTASNGVEFSWRTTDGAATSSNKVSGIAAPCWVKLVRTGSSFAGYYAADQLGTPGNWVQVGSTVTIAAINASLLSGLASASDNNTVSGAAVFDNVSGNTNRTVTITPTPGQSGLATINLVVSDGYYKATNAFNLTVGTGTPTQVRVETAPDGSGTVVPAQTIPSGGTLTSYAITRDVNGNFLANVTPNSWSLVNKTGGVVDGNLVASGASATFTASAIGSANIHVAVTGLTSVDSGLITVVPPPTGVLTIETAANGSGTLLTAQNVTSGHAITGYAIVRNAGGTFIANTNATWSLINTTGGVNGTNLVIAGDSKSANFNGYFTGSCQLQAVAAGLAVGSTNSGTLTVVAGTATQVLVETAANGSGTVVPAQTVSGGGTITAYAITRDAVGNFVANVTPNSWSLVNITDGVVNGDLAASGASATFTGNLAGTANIHATISGLTSVDSGLITVHPNLLGVIYSDPADAGITEVPAIESLTNSTANVGDGGSSPWVNRCVVYVFQLPSLGAIPNPFATASFTFNYAANHLAPNNTDLYGLGRRADATVLTNDYYGTTATPDPNAARLQTNILTGTTALGLITTSTNGSSALVNYLNTQYAAGTGAGQYVFLRLNTAAAKSGTQRASLTMSEGGVAGPPDTRPQINYTVIPPNTAPTLTPMNDQEVIAGQTMIFTNSATDSDLPAQTLTYSLQNAPAGATINPTNGVFNWRPTIAQSAAGGEVYDITVVVTDNGWPPLSDSDDFLATVDAPQNPALGSMSMSNGLFNFTINGDSGPDYTILVSTNLTTWLPLWTNSSPVPPFTFTDTSTNSNLRFYRVLMGP